MQIFKENIGVFAPLIIIGIAMILVFIIFEGAKSYNIDKIKRKTVGDGQHGTARYSNKSEFAKAHTRVKFTPEKWRNGIDLPTTEGIVCHVDKRKNAYINSYDNHIMLLAGPGAGKTKGFMCINLEYTLAVGNSFVTTDSKGDLLEYYGRIAKENYGYDVFVLDFRNPLSSDSNNLMYLVNRHFDEYKKDGKLRSLALAEKHAKIVAQSFVYSQGFSGGGQNAYFYDAAEGLIAAVCLLVSEFCEKEERHIVTVFQLILEMLSPSSDSTEKKKKTVGQDIMNHLPAEHKAKWLSGSALNSGGASSASVMTTAMSRLLKIIDSETEQIMCFDPPITTEQICSKKTAVFLVFPEEDKSKHVVVSMMIQQMYNAILAHASTLSGNTLQKRLYFFEDEFGIFPKQDNFKDIAAAGRSRNMFLVPVVQALSMLDESYGSAGAKTIMGCCQSFICGGFSPMSDDPERIVKKLGTQTVAGGSVSKSNSNKSGSNSQNISMMSRQLMTSDELRRLPKFNWLIQHGADRPYKAELPYFGDCGIIYDKPFKMKEKAAKPIKTGNAKQLKTKIVNKYNVEFVEPSEVYEDDGREIEMTEPPPVKRDSLSLAEEY